MKRGRTIFLSFFSEYGLFLIFFCGVMLFSLFGLQQTMETEREEAKRLAEESIRRGVITCYALEGVYPPSYDYLKERYGIQIDEERFQVFYDIFASNIMPEITVTAR